MEVLFLTATLPYPPTSGATLRTYNLLRRLALRHRIHLVAYGDLRSEGDRAAVLCQLCASIVLVPRRHTRTPLRFYLQLLLNLLSPRPVIVSRFQTPTMARTIQRALESQRFDLVCCDFTTLTANLPAMNGVPRHLTAHNVESVIWRRYLGYERNPLKALYIYLQYAKVLRFERKALSRFQHVSCVSEDDRERLKVLCPYPEYSLVPNGVDLDFFRPVPELEIPFRMVFTGSLDWRPNQEALRFFLARIYPFIKQAEPKASLLVVGREPPASLRSLAHSHPDVILRGTVADIRPYLATATIYVVPLRIGGGTRLKILEAMAMHRPVVTTAIGCEGLAVTPGREMLVADEPREFAKAVLRLFREPDLRASLADAARRVVEKLYDWNQIAETLDEAWQKAAANRQPQPCAGSRES